MVNPLKESLCCHKKIPWLIRNIKNKIFMIMFFREKNVSNVWRMYLEDVHRKH